jgi:predicted nucleic acid-binding protein
LSAFVLDCSVTIAWCFEGQASAYADSVMARLERQRAIVPSIWPLEVLNALLIGERRRKISPQETLRCLRMVEELPIAIQEVAAERVWTAVLGLARDLSISAYDAAYLELAVRLHAPLATGDEGLKNAARRAGVRLI